MKMDPEENKEVQSVNYECNYLQGGYHISVVNSLEWFEWWEPIFDLIALLWFTLVIRVIMYHLPEFDL